MKRRQSQMADKLDDQAKNIKLAEYGNYGEENNVVDKEHDDKINDALGLETD